jgi:hypothetical protein
MARIPVLQLIYILPKQNICVLPGALVASKMEASKMVTTMLTATLIFL